MKKGSFISYFLKDCLCDEAIVFIGQVSRADNPN